MQYLYVRYLHTTSVIVRKTWTLPKLLVSLSLSLLNLPVKYYFVLFLTAWSSKPLSVISRGLPRKHHRSQICKYCQLDNRATISPSSLLIVGFVLLSSKLRKGCALFGFGFCRVLQKTPLLSNTLAKFPKWSLHLHTSTSVPWWLLY